jgi:predicted amidohydrolase
MSEGLFAEVTHSARTKEIAIVGSLLERAGDRGYNTATFVNTRGEQIAAYRKIHLVPMLDEDKYLSAGDEASVFNATDTEPPHRAALAVCYDLRFPELFRYFALSGAEMVFLPSEWPTRRIAHFRTLIRARAIENQMFVIATNRVGTSQGEEFGGYSAIVDPWGETVVGAADSEALVLGEIDLSIVEEVRARVPVFANRRPDVYQKLGQ